MPEERLLRIAEALSDGIPVDWDAEERRSADAGEKGRVHQLRLVASLASAQRSAESAARDSAKSLEEAPTLVHSSEGGSATPAYAGPIGEARRTWGHLRIDAPIGQGAFGDVYRAWDETLDRQVALKLLKQDGPGSDRLGSAILAEGRLLAKFHHSNVVAVYGAERHEGQIGLWMEYIKGHTLASLIREQGLFGPREAAQIGVELCKALAAVHRAGIVHGDVKSWNVMREDGGRIVLMDFGAGRDSSRDPGGAGQQISGTPLYMAPELLRGEPATPSCDLYALGVLLFHLVTGSYPVEAASLTQLRELHKAGATARLRDLRPDLPSRFVQVVESALAPDPAMRYPTAGAMEAALNSEADDRGARPVPPDPRREWFRDWRTWAAAAVMTAGVAMVTMVAILAPDRFLGRMASQRQSAPADAQADRAEEAPLVPTQNPGEFVPAGAPGKQAETLPVDAARSSPIVSRPRVDAALYRAGGFLPERLTNGGTIRQGDQVYLEIRFDEPLHIYFLNRDDQGEVWALFPLEGAAIRNPVPPGGQRQLPGVVNGSVTHWGVSSAGGRESFLLVASREPLVELERTLEAVARPGLDVPVEEQTMAIAMLRGIGKLVPAEPERPNGGAPPGLAAVLRRLTEASEDVWMTEIVLDNPAE